MSKDYTAIRFPEEAVEAAKDAKRDGETWGDYLQRCTDNPPEVQELVPADEVEATAEQLKNELSMAADPTVQPDVAGLIEKVDRLADAVQEATEAAQQTQQQLERMETQR